MVKSSETTDNAARTACRDPYAGLEERVEAYWDERSAAFSGKRRLELLGENADRWLELLTEKLPRRPLRILDIGTGAGFFAILLAGQGHDVTGIDMSEKMLEEARKNSRLFHQAPRFCRMNAMHPAFEAESFDAVVTRNLTWTLPDVEQAYRAWYRLLRQDGVLLNFDSDNGLLSYRHKRAANDVHADVSDRLLEECTEILDSLAISRNRRPAWDIGCLRKIGFSVTWDADVAPRVHADRNLAYDGVPVFGLYAVK